MNLIYIVIPTYNEKENIGPLVNALSKLGISDLHLLVVDDTSPDGTGDIVEGLKKQYQNLEVLHRPKKEGLGKAYVAGFCHALEKGAELIFEMDADFSHNPSDIPRFLKAAREYDLILGSRYIAGGRILYWNVARRIISRLGNMYARYVLGMPFRDLTGGFKCFRRKVLESIDFKNASSLGYNFQIEMTHKAYKKGFSIKEIPIIFTERRQGRSKFSIKIMFESFWKILLLRFRRWP